MYVLNQIDFILSTVLFTIPVFMHVPALKHVLNDSFERTGHPHHIK